MSSNVFFHAFCAGCGTEVADNGASIPFNCASCKPHIKEPESRIEIVINKDLAAKDDVVVAVAGVADVIDVVVVASTTPISIVTDDEEWEDKQRAMRVLDDIEEAKRNGEWAAYDDDDDDHYMCQCDNCAGYGDEDDGYADDGYGLDWNESGYFD